jgi:arginine-tRNA-protein transferase
MNQLYGMHFIRLRQHIEPAFMDALLSMGWYRMSQHVFTTRLVRIDFSNSIEVLWIRIDLKDYELPARHLRLRKINKHFHLSQRQGCITEEIEALYKLYLEGIDFEASDSVKSYLQEEGQVNFFPTRLWQLRHKGALIGFSYFDEGIESAAGILTGYDHAYKKYSPGTFLYLESVWHAAQNGMKFFYPGYIALGTRKFDYKLLAGLHRIQVLDESSGKWIPYSESRHAQTRRHAS